MCVQFGKTVIKETKIYSRVKINKKSESESRPERFQNACE